MSLRRVSSCICTFSVRRREYFAVILCFRVTGLLCVVASALPGYGVFSQADVLVMCVCVCIVGVAVSSKQERGEPMRIPV